MIILKLLVLTSLIHIYLESAFVVNWLFCCRLWMWEVEYGLTLVSVGCECQWEDKWGEIGVNLHRNEGSAIILKPHKWYFYKIK